MKSSRALPYVFTAIIAVLFVFLFFGASRGWYGFHINHEVDPVALATLCVNLLIAVFLQYYFIAKASDDRAEKDILLKNVEDVFNFLRTCRDDIHACRDSVTTISVVKRKKVVTSFKNLYNGLENLETALNLSGCKKLTNDWDVLVGKLIRYKSISTGHFPHPYDATEIGLQDQAYRALNNDLHALGFKINRH